MSNFIVCSVLETPYRNYKIKNNPVNIDLCTELIKHQEAWYPDNIGMPAIKFKGCGVKWVYRNEKDRDLDFDKILLL